MTTAVQDAFDTVLAAVADDRRSNSSNSREAVRVAVNAAARAHGQRVTAATIRPYLPSWVATPQIGSTVNRLRSRGYLVKTGKYTANGKGGDARNQGKRSPIYKVTGHIPREAVQP